MRIIKPALFAALIAATFTVVIGAMTWSPALAGG